MDIKQIKIDPQKLQKARKDAGLTQEEVAEMLGLTKGAISQMETGKAEPRGNTLLRLLISYRICSPKNLQKLYSRA